MILSEVEETYLDEELDKISNKTVTKVIIKKKINEKLFFFFFNIGKN